MDLPQPLRRLEQRHPHPAGPEDRLQPQLPEVLRRRPLVEHRHQRAVGRPLQAHLIEDVCEGAQVAGTET